MIVMTTENALYTEARPWGCFTVLIDSAEKKVKSLTVNPGGRLSLQMHHKREEHWIMTAGIADITLGEDTKAYKKGDYIFIPTGTKHRIANTGTEDVSLIEVQLGDYFGEDDIVRFQDDYNRA
jgi:mannose-6-phosphate isomerase-like protein (cupin superfamily)